MRALALDTETTGLNPAEHRAIEVAVCLFELDRALPLSSFSSLIRAESNAAEAINRIPAAALIDAPPADAVWRRVQWYVEQADVVLAHRAEFDRSFCPEPVASARPWVCSKFWIEWPLGKPGEHLVHLALAHGISVVTAHRAAADVDILVRLLMRVHEMGHPLPALIQRAMRPRHKVQAIVSYEDREQAKSAGFAWDSDKRAWWREAFTDEVFPFPTRPA